MSLVAESFRSLRTNLQFLGLDQPLKSLLLTSAAPGEGKTTTMANLAVAFAQTGAKVCIVDGDLRRPMMARMFRLDNWSGLTTVLIGQAELESTVRETAVPGLSVLTSGPVPPNPSELVGSARMTALLQKLESQYDMVLVDSPPVMAVADAAVMAPKVGGVLLVVRAGAVPRRQAIRAKAALEAVKANLLGAVLDAFKSEGKSGYAYYYRYQSGEGAKAALDQP
jgi:protein-tyrosine kinase